MFLLPLLLACPLFSAPPTYVDDIYYANVIPHLNSPQFIPALQNITTYNFVRVNYDCIWEIISETDAFNSTHLSLIYSSEKFPTYLRDDGITDSAWNREHVYPARAFSSSDPQYTDAHHIRACHKSVNSLRQDRDFKSGGDPKCIHYIDDRCQAWVNSTSSSWEIEPVHRGDVARMLFYMEIKYQMPLLDEDTYGTGKSNLGWRKTLYLWNEEDPVSEFEKNRHEKLYYFHHVRNPFIDHPEWVEIII